MAFPPSRVETVMSPVSMRIASRYAEAFSQVLDEHQQAEASLEELRATTGLLNSINCSPGRG